MTKGFGLTWWGEHWLQSLNNIDEENRLPRGASYARTGHVEELEIQGNKVSARVIGTRARPYKVKLFVPTFPNEKKEAFIDALVENPSLISRLLSRQLDPRILTLAENLGMKVFPESWTDLGMECNCPDSAVPCKHLAAVIYMLSREIDNNPFLVFELRGIDLLKELELRGVRIGAKQKLEVPLTQSRFRIGGDPVGIQDPDHELSMSKRRLQTIDFTQLKEVGDAVWNILPDFPPFYERGNFRAIFSKDMKRVMKGAEKLLVSMNMAAYSNPDIRMEIDRDTDYIVEMNDYMELKVNGRVFEGSMSISLMEALLEIPHEILKDYPDSVLALRMALSTALHLIQTGSMRPLLTLRPDEKYAIDWIPLYMDAPTRNVMSALHEIFPKRVVDVQLTCADAPQPFANEAEMLVSYFLGTLISMFSKDTHAYQDKIRSMFLNQESQFFDDVGETEKPGNILSWLKRLEVTWERYVPVLKVKEVNDDGTQFSAEVYLQDKNDPVRRPSPLSEVLEANQMAGNDNFELLHELSALSSLVPGLTKLLDDKGAGTLLMDNHVFSRFLMEMVPSLKFLGVQVELPASLERLIRPRPSMTISASKRGRGLSYLNFHSLLQFNWQVALGDEMMSLTEFNRLLGENMGLIKMGSGYLYVDETDIQNLHKVFREQKPLTSLQLLQTALSEEYEGTKVCLTPEVKEMIDEFTSLSSEKIPEGLNAQLRPYQERGYSWMWRNLRIGFGSIIADDMGLGKTLQVIALLQRLKNEGALAKKKALVVAPTGLLTNWQAEMERFAPQLTSFIYHGAQRAIWGFDHDVLITSYGVLRSDEVALKKLPWRVMVIDEAQTIKNSNTAQSKAVRNMPAETHIAMSGTPVENRLTEYWSIMEFVNKGYLGSAKQFQKNFVRPIQNDGDPKVAERFRRITGPLMMRRMKSDKSIIADLPDKIEENRYAALTPKQVALYQNVVQSAMSEIEEVKSVDNRSLFKRQGLVLQMILALKQICNHPSQYLKEDDRNPLLSGKVQMLLDLLDTILLSGEKVLVFTQFREMGEILSDIIQERFKKRPMFYHGGCTIKERQEMVESFQNDPRKQIFLLSLRAAGTGLNLTAASHVIHFDLWWNPAVEQQATDRAFRIGQGKNVMVHRFITRNTFEEKIDEMIQRKKELAELTVAAGENWIGRLSNKELHEIFDR